MVTREIGWKGVQREAQCGGPRSPEELGCVIKTLIIQSITNAIIGGQADGRGERVRGGRRVDVGGRGFPVILEFDSRYEPLVKRCGLDILMCRGSMVHPGLEEEGGGARGTIVN